MFRRTRKELPNVAYTNPSVCELSREINPLHSPWEDSSGKKPPPSPWEDSSGKNPLPSPGEDTRDNKTLYFPLRYHATAKSPAVCIRW